MFMILHNKTTIPFLFKLCLTKFIINTMNLFINRYNSTSKVCKKFNSFTNWIVFISSIKVTKNTIFFNSHKSITTEFKLIHKSRSFIKCLFSSFNSIFTFFNIFITKFISKIHFSKISYKVFLKPSIIFKFISIKFGISFNIIKFLFKFIRKNCFKSLNI